MFQRKVQRQIKVSKLLVLFICIEYQFQHNSISDTNYIIQQNTNSTIYSSAKILKRLTSKFLYQYPIEVFDLKRVETH